MRVSLVVPSAPQPVELQDPSQVNEPSFYRLLVVWNCMQAAMQFQVLTCEPPLGPLVGSTWSRNQTF